MVTACRAGALPVISGLAFLTGFQKAPEVVSGACFFAVRGDLLLLILSRKVLDDQPFLAVEGHAYSHAHEIGVDDVSFM